MLLLSCQKKEATQPPIGCDMQKVYAENTLKATITTGIWGTVAFMEGNCMPPSPPARSTCSICPVKRTIRIYEYTTPSQATPQSGQGFYESFSTTLIKEFETDNNGFFQTSLPSGTYTVVVLENGLLYTFGLDEQGGLSPVRIISGKQQVNLTLTYKAAF